MRKPFDAGIIPQRRKQTKLVLLLIFKENTIQNSWASPLAATSRTIRELILFKLQGFVYMASIPYIFNRSAIGFPVQSQSDNKTFRSLITWNLSLLHIGFFLCKLPFMSFIIIDSLKIFFGSHPTDAQNILHRPYSL